MERRTGSVTLKGDAMWGRPCLAYNVQAKFDDDSRRDLSELQAELARRLSAPMNLCPTDTLHVSIFPIVPVRRPEGGKAELWRRLEAPCRAEFAAAHEEWSPLAVVFREVRVTPSAIILSTPDQPAPLADLRARFNQVVAAAGLPSLTFDQTHVTLARPIVDGAIGQAEQRAIEATPLGIKAVLAGISLVRELVYPSLVVETLA